MGTTRSCYSRRSHDTGHHMQGTPLPRPLSDDPVLVLCI